MDTYVVLNALHIDARAFEPLFPNGDSALLRTAVRARVLSDIDTLFLLVPDEETGRKVLDHLGETREDGGLHIPLPEIRTTGEFLQGLETCAAEAGRLGAAGGGAFFHLYADAPLVDPEMAKRMAEHHRVYHATYSFADGYPRFLAPELVSVSALGQIGTLYRSRRDAGKDTPLTDAVLFDIIQKDINAFDIETEIAPRDLRLLRVDLAARGKRNAILLKRLIDAGAEDEASVMRLLVERPEMLRTVPAYICLQISSGCPQRCSWCPYPTAPGSGIDRREVMEPERLSSILDQVVRLCGDAVVGLSLWGEPALHPRVAEMAAEVLRRPELSLLIETSGIGWTLSTLDAIRDAEGAGERLDWIVSLDALSPGLYRAVRGEGMEEAAAALRALAERFPGRVRAQAVRTRENEAELEQFYRYWKKEGIDVIIQKYDSYAGRLPDLTVTDLSPVERFPCWHLKRELHVLLDGTVPLCREILPGTGSAEEGTILGNVFEEPLEVIWERGAARYIDHTLRKWGEPCGSCDEYYTFNF